MKLGILTYHRSHNYGTILQAYALRKTLVSLGHDAFFVDYWPQHQQRLYALFSRDAFRKLTLSGKAAYLKSFLLTLAPKLLRRRKFDLFFRSEIAPFCRTIKEAFDAIVYGSDQIWRKQYFNMGYNPVYFGKDPFKTEWRISYAASMGDLPKNEAEKALVLEHLKHLDRISVRESGLRDFLTHSGFSDVAQTIDPVFLLQSTKWRELAGSSPLVSKPYLLFYDLQPGAFDEAALVRFSSRHGLDLVRISGTAFRWPSKNNRTTAGPREFLNLVLHAKAVATSSFHGMAFSILFGTPFLASFRSKGKRAESLLAHFGLSYLLLTPGTPFPDDIPVTDRKKVEIAIESARTESIGWLVTALERHKEPDANDRNQR